MRRLLFSVLSLALLAGLLSGPLLAASLVLSMTPGDTATVTCPTRLTQTSNSNTRRTFSCRAASPTPSPSPTPTPTLAPTPTPTPTPQTGDLQALINAASSGDTINYSGTHNGSVTVNKPLTIVGGRVNGKVTITASDVTLRSMTVLGPQFATYVGGQHAIYAANVSGVTLDQVEAGNAGDSGIRLHYVTGFTILAPNVHDTVYAGIITTSSTDGLIDGGTVARVGMNGSSAANSNNAYGIALTRYLTSEPKAARITVRNVTVSDVPTWHGLDTHGGLDIVFENNSVARTYRGIMLTGVGGQRVTARNNAISAASYMGIAVVDTRPYTVTGNTITTSPTYAIFVDATACGTLGPNTTTGSGQVLNNGTVC